jgi:hypothetical protein
MQRIIRDTKVAVPSYADPFVRLDIHTGCRGEPVGRRAYRQLRLPEGSKAGDFICSISYSLAKMMMAL